MTTTVTMHKIDGTGDGQHGWDVADPDSVEIARSVFSKYRKLGYLAYTGEPGSGRGEQVTEFDPATEHYYFAPPMAGG